MFRHPKTAITILVLIVSLAGILRANPPVGDLDGNFMVNIQDMGGFADQWLGDPNGSANLNGDDKINMNDFVLLAENWQTGTPLIISEFMANKGSSLATREEVLRQPGVFEYVNPDWIEIYNISDQTLNLAGWYLTDNEDNLTKWQLPSITINPGQYKVIFASEKEQKYYPTNYPYLDPNGYYHTNFELSRGGEYLALVRPDGVTVADEYAPEYPNQRGFISYGYCSNTREYGYFVNPTPGAANSSTCLTRVVDDTKFSHDRGFYESDFYVTISTTTSGATIRYTTDGNEPSETLGNTYTGPIHITTTAYLRAMAYKTGYLPTNVDTQTYIFLDDVLTQTGAGLPDTWGKYGADYEMDPDVVYDINYISTIKNDLKAVPTMSLVMSLDDWFNPSTDLDIGGIYANPEWTAKSKDYDQRSERAVSVELIDPCGLEEFQLNAAIKVVGWSSTLDWKMDKLSMRLKFREPIGPTKLNFPLLGDEVTDNFDTLILDARMNNSWAYGGTGTTQNLRAQYTRDQFASDLHNAMAGGYSPNGKEVHLYINGLYWGLYWVHERPDESFASTYFGGKKDDYDCIKHNKDLPVKYEVINGTDANYVQMFSIANYNLALNENYQLIQQYLDVPNYIDYILMNFYGGNTDWLDNNYYVNRNAYDPASRWRYHSWDAEHIMESLTQNIIEDKGVVHLHYRMELNAEYRMLFADHVHRHFFNNGVLTPGRLAALYQIRLNEVDRAVVGESARWGDNQIAKGIRYTRDVHWVAQRGWLLGTYFPGRTSTALGHLKTLGWYPNVYAPVFNPHGGWNLTGFTVTMTNPNASGTIWYTTDGSDPRLPGGAVNTASATSYTPGSNINITVTTQLKARVLKSGIWSALNEAIYAVGPVADNLRITEIMYHPQDTGDPNDPNEEFIELMNIGTESINLKLVSFTMGINFTFPSISLDPNGYILVVKNQSAFDAQYPGFSGVIAGEYTGSLANDGERIKLEDANGQTIHNFSYKDGWYDVTDGMGFSLTIRDACGINPCDWGLESSWGASTYKGGSPGEGDTGPKLGDIVINEILAHSEVEPYDWIELYNTTDKTIDIGGWFLSDSDKDEPNLMKYQIAEGTTVAPGEYIVFTEQQFGDQNDPNCHIAFALSENGETVYLSSGIPGELTLTGFRDERDFRASDPDVAFGLYTKSSLSAAAGDPTDFVAMSQNTKGLPNTYPPKVGPIVIAEIMYKPEGADDPELEYIKLVNISGSSVTLQRYYPDEDIYVQWKFTDSIRYTFPSNTTIAAGGYIYVVYDPAEFASAYPGVSSSRIFGPFENDDGGERMKLSNSGEDLELSKPGDKDEQTGERFYILVDRVNYSDGDHPKTGYIDPWPTEPDGDGKSLHRITLGEFGNDVINWQADDPSPNSP